MSKEFMGKPIMASTGIVGYVRVLKGEGSATAVALMANEEQGKIFYKTCEMHLGKEEGVQLIKDLAEAFGLSVEIKE